jgi:hypothetical protein
MIQYLKHNQIDKTRWDNCIENSFNKLPYAFSWYLDIVSPNWDALVYNEYLAVMPLTKRKKYGFHYLYQPILCQQLGVFSTIDKDVFNIDQFIKAIPKHFKLAEININTNNCLSDNLIEVQKNNRINYLLPLKEEYVTLQQRYSKNHRKNINRFYVQVADHQVKSVTCSEFYSYKSGFINNWKNSFSKSSKQTYLNILKNLEKSGKSKTYFIYDKQKSLLAGICYIYVNEMVTIQTFVTKIGRKSGVLYFMIDEFIKENATKDLTLDFMGSMIPGVAYWNNGFGSTVSNYEFIRLNRLPKFIDRIVTFNHRTARLKDAQY